MARKRVSMHEGPLAELFRATEAAQSRQAAQAVPAQTEILPAEHAPTEILSIVPELPEPAPAEPEALQELDPVQEDTEPEPDQPLARWLEPLPESPARLERPRTRRRATRRRPSRTPLRSPRLLPPRS